MQANRLYNLPSMPFVPNAHRKNKKDGGVWGQAYYTPLPVSPEHFTELADTIKLACSEKNVKRLENENGNESWEVLNGIYLEDGQWYSIYRDTPLPVFPK